jgi:hypothetical protein
MVPEKTGEKEKEKQKEGNLSVTCPGFGFWKKKEKFG